MKLVNSVLRCRNKAAAAKSLAGIAVDCKRAQLLERPGGRCNKGVEALVGRITQRQR